MNIIVGETAGFCFGVKNAVTKTEKAIYEHTEISCLGELVHNTQVTQALEKKGVKFIDNINQAKGTTIIRSHGVTKNIYEEAKKRNLKLLDLTCPKVLHIHNIAENYAKQGYYIFIVGQSNHPEMEGTVSFCGDFYTVIEEEKDIPKALVNLKETKIKKAIILAQTTYSLEKFNIISQKIKEQLLDYEIEVKNTICDATKQRQLETEKIAKQVDLMIIIGGKHSSNSNKLYEISKKYCQTLFVETENEIPGDMENRYSTIGIMAGASTPQESIKKILEKLSKIC